MMVTTIREAAVEDRTQALERWAAERGYRVGWAPIAALDLVRDELRHRAEAGEIDRDFARDQLSFAMESAVRGHDGWTVVIVAKPRPAHVVTFSMEGGPFDAVLPPTYERYRQTFAEVRRELGSRVFAGARVETLEAPLKASAARLGLARYGRNNLAYVAPFGSYIQLLGYATNARLRVEADWAPQEPRLLDECAACRACERSCPTGAIVEDRVLLRAERCLTLANENGGDWPGWVPDSAHHCLLGCLRCQSICPANPTLPTRQTGIVFTAHETGVLLADGEHRGRAWKAIRGKLRRLGQPYSEPAIPRNLRALVEAWKSGRELRHRTPRLKPRTEGGRSV
jgi:epoxyqueuosine reductase